jgi:aminopeptidase N
MKATSASQRNKQDTALLIAKQLTEFWLGNYVTFKWWDELYLQESFGILIFIKIII